MKGDLQPITGSRVLVDHTSLLKVKSAGLKAGDWTGTEYLLLQERLKRCPTVWPEGG